MELCTVIYEALAAVATPKKFTAGGVAWQSIWLLPRSETMIPEGRWAVANHTTSASEESTSTSPVLDIPSILKYVCPDLVSGDTGRWIVAMTKTGILYRMLRPILSQGFKCKILPTISFKGSTVPSSRAHTGTDDTTILEGVDPDSDTEPVSDFEDGFTEDEPECSPMEPTFGYVDTLETPTRPECRKPSLRTLPPFPPRGYTLSFYHATLEPPCLSMCGHMLDSKHLQSRFHATGAAEAESVCKQQFGEGVLLDSERPKHVVTTDGLCAWEPRMTTRIKDRVVSSPMLTPKEGMTVTIVPLVPYPGKLVEGAEEVFKSVLSTTSTVVPGISLQLVQNKDRFYVICMYHFNAYHYKEAVSVWQTTPNKEATQIHLLHFSERTDEVLSTLGTISTKAAHALCGKTQQKHLQTDMYTWNTWTVNRIDTKWSYFTLHNHTYAPQQLPGSYAMIWYGRDMGWMKVEIPATEEEHTHAPPIDPKDDTKHSTTTTYLSQDIPLFATVMKRPEVHAHSIDPTALHSRHPLVPIQVRNRGAFGYDLIGIPMHEIMHVLQADPLYANGNFGTINPLLNNVNGHVSRSALVIAI